MTQLQSKQIEAEALLRTLSESDDRPWCFVPLELRLIQWQSDGFRKLWAFRTQNDSVANGASESPSAIEDLIASAESKAPIIIGQHKWLVESVVVIDEAGRPVGRLFHLISPEGNAGHPALMISSYEAQSRLATLSPREAEILELVYNGYTNKAIAARTNISQKTVEKHRGRVTRKLQTSSLAELIRLVATARLADAVRPDVVSSGGSE